jgi:hypothetical protein
MNAQNPIVKLPRIKKDGLISNAIKNQKDYMARQRARFTFIEQAAKRIDESWFPKDTRFYMESYGITIYIPWSKSNLIAIRKAIGAGWKYNNQYQNSNGTLTKNYYMYMEDEYITLTLIMDAEQLVEGTCKRILVESKVELVEVTKQTYKVICEDGTEMMEVESEREV